MTTSDSLLENTIYDSTLTVSPLRLNKLTEQAVSACITKPVFIHILILVFAATHDSIPLL